jgi:hypothetical protein
MNDQHCPPISDPDQPVVMVVDDDLFTVHIARIALERMSRRYDHSFVSARRVDRAQDCHGASLAGQPAD